jgi:hypothetical protein
VNYKVRNVIKRKKGFTVVHGFIIYSFKFMFGGWVCLNFQVSFGLLELTPSGEVVGPLNQLGRCEVHGDVGR